jgi:arylsulfatase A-like enzyme
MNVVLVILDSLRRDHVGVYGNDLIQTPNLDALAKDSLRFTRPYPESIPTICSRRAIYTGKRTWPFRNWTLPRGETIFAPAGWQKIPEDQTSIVRTLSEAGYQTTLVTDTFHLFKPSYNFQQGFETFDYVRGQAKDAYRLGPVPSDKELGQYTIAGSDAQAREKVKQHLTNNVGREREEDYFAPQVFSRAIEKLGVVSEGERPFFMVVDSFDPHEPWDTPEPYRSMYGEPLEDGEPVQPNYGSSDYLTERELRRMRELYAAEVILTDHWFGRFLNRLEDLGMFENTLLITLSDHGVAIGEHGFTGKMPNVLWPEITDIVFYVRHPEGKGSGKSSEFYASLHDVAPTVLANLGLDQPQPMDGQDLTPILEGRSLEEERPHFTLGYDNYSWARDEEYVMFCLNDGTEAKLYDLSEDPEMDNDLAEENPQIVHRMYEEYIVSDAGGEPPPIY